MAGIVTHSNQVTPTLLKCGLKIGPAGKLSLAQFMSVVFYCYFKNKNLF